MKPDPVAVVTQQVIVSGLIGLGIQPGDGLVVHSSLSSFGRVEGGAPAVISALMEVLTAEGTLVMPSFNHYAPFEDENGAGIYDPLVTPTSNGCIPDTFWRMTGVARSLNPSHPIAAWGKHSLRYTRFHHRTLTMGPDSPLGLLAADGGYALMLGVGYGPNTFHHVVEMSTRAPCLGRRTESYPVRLPDGRIVQGRTWGWRERGCPITDANAYREEMEALDREVNIGACRAILFRLSDCYAVIARMLSEGVGENPPCSRCPIRPRQTSAAVLSDWDEETQTLRPDSAAWGY